MVLSTSKVHISYRAWWWVRASVAAPPAAAVQQWGTGTDKPLKAAGPQREGGISHRHLGSGSNFYVIFFLKKT